MCIMLREVILTVLAHRPMTGYEIARNFDQVLSHFWRASHQQIYRELARMSSEGDVVFRAVAQSGKPEKSCIPSPGRAARHLRNGSQFRPIRRARRTICWSRAFG